MKRCSFIFFVFHILIFQGFSQETFKVLSVEEAINMALENNPEMKIAALKTDKSAAAAISIPSANFSYQYGQINSYENDYYFEINQNFGSIPAHAAELKIRSKQMELDQAGFELTRRKLIIKVKSAYYQWVYLHEKVELFAGLKQLYDSLSGSAEIQYESGEISLLEKIRQNTQMGEIRLQYMTLQDDLMSAQATLNELILNSTDIVPGEQNLEMYMIEKSGLEEMYSGGKILEAELKNVELGETRIKREKSLFFPEISAGYFRQDITPLKNLDGWQVGLSFPLLYFSQSSRVRQARIDYEIARASYEYRKNEITFEVERLLFDLNKQFKKIVFYKNQLLVQADEIIHAYTLQFDKDEIGFPGYVNGIAEGMKIKSSYLDLLNDYNQTALQLEYFTD